ncbi:MAG: hypothetical protein ACRD21_01360, partial [Vicinamibacteria bacterium]
MLSALAVILLFSRQTPELRPGWAVERPLAEGETHDYEVLLTEDEYFDVALEHDGGVNVSLSLEAPGGETLVRVGVNHPLRSERLAVVAEEEGVHRLVVSGREGGEPKGSYRLRVAERRDATASDRIRARALRTVAETEPLRDGSD